MPADLQKYSGRAWRKVAAGLMPPRSVAMIFPEMPLGDADRERLATRFFPGAP